MQDDKAGIAFHETMAGPFALGEADPHVGAEKGKAAGTTLSITCAINIHDLDRFITDPDHYGDIIGQVSFTPFEEKRHMGRHGPLSFTSLNLFILYPSIQISTWVTSTPPPSSTWDMRMQCATS